MKKSLVKTLTLAAIIIGCKAQALTFDKPITATVLINKPSPFVSAHLFPSKKTVTLMNIHLTAEQKQILNEFDPEDGAASSITSQWLPHQYDRGMNGTPVLDQGKHGTCATFANTAAIDALIGKGDYVSQLCNLSLGYYFEQKGYLPSGWEGALGAQILNQMIGFGIIDKNTQKTKSCGGLNDYPLINSAETGNPMSLDEFKESSEDLSRSITWEALQTFHERFEERPRRAAHANALLLEIKKALVRQSQYEDSRLTFGVFLPVSYCSAGACARYHAENDTWALTTSIKKDKEAYLAGHEMVITGYNDDAVAFDNEGGKHQGLLIIRNSWGTEVGDQGNYYMTYDFFKKYVLEVQKVTIFKNSIRG